MTNYMENPGKLLALEPSTASVIASSISIWLSLSHKSSSLQVKEKSERKQTKITKIKKSVLKKKKSEILCEALNVIN